MTVRPVTPGEFCARVIPALSAREVENNLPIGIARRLLDRPEGARGAVLLSVEASGLIVAAAVRTPPHDVVVTRLPDGAAAVVADHFAALGVSIPGVSGPDQSGLDVARRLAARLGGEVGVRARQRLYELTAVNDVPRASGDARLAGTADQECVRDWYLAFSSEARLPHQADASEWARLAIESRSAFLWVDGEPRALACRSRETPNGRAIGPVYTPPAARRRGYATSLVAEVSRATLAGGKRFACLFTDAANPTANHIYESIGFRFVCGYDAYTLSAPAPRA